jgi:chemotaxis protein methyltransferase WspC
MNLGPVLSLLQTRTGLESGSLGTQTVEAAVLARMKALGARDGDAYAARLRHDDAEFAALLDEVVVPETWFFRGGDVFGYLAGLIRSALLSRPAFRALSLPCSTGEEPYSLAIALAERRVTGCAIDGVDISPRNLDEARRGVFGELSFRQTPPALRGRYFSAVPGGWELDPAIRPAVRFLPGNVLDPLLLPAASYDLILCRNLFIYLGPAARQRALANLDRMLAPGGLLGLGFAEPIDRADRRFEPAGPADLFLYRRPPATLPPPAVPLLPAPRPAPLLLPQPRRAEPPPEPARTIERARLAADRGSYEEAYTLCDRLLAESGPDADTYALMGVIQQARHLTEEARRHLERALYLAPNHREALFHLLLLHEQRGDAERAGVLRRRLERAGSVSDG